MYVYVHTYVLICCSFSSVLYTDVILCCLSVGCVDSARPVGLQNNIRRRSQLGNSITLALYEHSAYTCNYIRTYVHTYVYAYIRTGQCKKALSKKDPPKTLGTRVSYKTGTWLDGQRARQA